jgi:hypothetical protein
MNLQLTLWGGVSGMLSGARFLLKSTSHSLLISIASLANSSHNLSGYLFAQLTIFGSGLLKTAVLLRRRLARSI